jgi:hypothetical protein
MIRLNVLIAALSLRADRFARAPAVVALIDFIFLRRAQERFLLQSEENDGNAEGFLFSRKF